MVAWFPVFHVLSQGNHHNCRWDGQCLYSSMETTRVNESVKQWDLISKTKSPGLILNIFPSLSPWLQTQFLSDAKLFWNIRLLGMDDSGCFWNGLSMQASLRHTHDCVFVCPEWFDFLSFIHSFLEKSFLTLPHTTYIRYSLGRPSFSKLVSSTRSDAAGRCEAVNLWSVEHKRQSNRPFLLFHSWKLLFRSGTD